MSINSLPSSLQAIIQTGYLERTFQEALQAKLGFRAIAEREAFTGKVGETITKTRTGLRPAALTALSTASSTDLTSGLTDSSVPVEQFTMTLGQYGDTADTNIVTEGVAVKSKFLIDAKTLGEQAARTIDQLACNSLFNAYMGGNTRVKTTLGSNGPAVAVDDVRGFAAADLVTVGSSTYTVSSIAIDGSNTSTVFGGKSGVITFTGSVTIANATAGNPVVGSKAPLVVRPNARTNTSLLTTGDVLTASMILNAKAQMEANNIPKVDGFYHYYCDPIQASALYADDTFKSFLRGRSDSSEYRDGVIAEMLGVKIIMTNINPVDSNFVRRGILVGKGALIEADFTAQGYANVANVRDPDMIKIVDGVAHIVREPLDKLSAWVSQSWVWYGSFCVPTDAKTDSTVLPTASARAYKRGIVLETL